MPLCEGGMELLEVFHQTQQLILAPQNQKIGKLRKQHELHMIPPMTRRSYHTLRKERAGSVRWGVVNDRWWLGDLVHMMVPWWPHNFPVNHLRKFNE